MYNKINLMLPTYGRSKTSLPKFISSCVKTMHSKDNIVFTFLVNVKDTDTRDYFKNLVIAPEFEVILENTSSPDLGKYFNMMYDLTVHQEKETVVTMLGDDMVFKTKDWDSLLLKKINDKKGIGVFYCNDNYTAKEKMCVNLFLTRKFVDMVGSLFMADFKADFIDTVWYQLGKMTDTLNYSPEIIIQHNHASKIGEDDTYIRTKKNRRDAWVNGSELAKKIALKMKEALLSYQY